MRSDRGMTHNTRFWFQMTVAVLRRPSLWRTAMVQIGRLARPRWWSRPPFLPWPDPGYIRFRMETAYGARGEPRAADVIRYLEWCRESA